MRLANFAALMCCVLLLGCSSDDSDSSSRPETALPYVGAVYSRIDHYHPTYWTKFNPPLPEGVEEPEQTGLMVNFEIQMSYLSGLSNLTEIFVSNPSENSRWDVPLEPVNLSEEQPLESLAAAELGTHVFYEHSLQRVVLDGYEITAVDSQGNKTIKSVDLTGFNDGSREGRKFVYSSAYSSSKLMGMKGMEAMSIADNEISFEEDAEAQTFIIGFTPKDSRAKDYKIEFYGPSPERELIGTTDFLSPPVPPVVPPVPPLPPILSFGHHKIIEVPYEEIELEDGMEAQDLERIAGLHIVLIDKPIKRKVLGKRLEEDNQEMDFDLCSVENPEANPEWCPTYKWTYNYAGYSEFVPLPTPSDE